MCRHHHLIQIPCLIDRLFLADFVETRLAVYGLALSRLARETILESLKALCRSKYFDGYKTIKMLCQDIVYEHYSAEDASRSQLTQADLAAFAPGSNYVKKAIKNSEKMRRIGFDAGEV